MREYLERLGINPLLAEEVMKFRDRYPPAGESTGCASCEVRLLRPPTVYIGAEIAEMAAAALLEGANLLLCGPKASGKNVLADNLAYIFGRPVYNISFHVNTDSASLIGSDTFERGQVVLRKGPVYMCAEQGGFGIFDEVNMAKNESVAVLHSTLDHRRLIDVPGYDLIRLHPAARFIGTMNYGYAGTRELNEALVSRFLVIDMPQPDEETLGKILSAAHPELKPDARDQLCGLFLDLVAKNDNGELSTKPIDLRGLISAIGIVKFGIKVRNAVKMGLANKSFDTFERDVIDDALRTRVPEGWGAGDIFD